MSIFKNYILWPILALLLTTAIYLSLVMLMQKSLILLTPKQEEYLWKIISKDFIISNNKQQESIQSLVDKLPPELLPKRYPKITILIAEDDYINAFAAPGGRVILTSGLVEKIKNKDTMLFIIGHEIAHLAREDHLYEFARMMISNTYGLITFSKLLPELLMLLDLPKVYQTEFLADKRSLEIMLNFYGNIEKLSGAKDFFQILLEQNNLSPSTTHPDTIKRLDKVNEFIYKNKK